MNERAADGCAAIVVGCLMFFAGLMLGDYHSWRSVQQDAIDHGAAEWRVDPKTGETKFVWLTDGTAATSVEE